MLTQKMTQSKGISIILFQIIFLILTFKSYDSHAFVLKQSHSSLSHSFFGSIKNPRAFRAASLDWSLEDDNDNENINVGKNEMIIETKRIEGRGNKLFSSSSKIMKNSLKFFTKVVSSIKELVVMAAHLEEGQNDDVELIQQDDKKNSVSSSLYFTVYPVLVLLSVHFLSSILPHKVINHVIGLPLAIAGIIYSANYVQRLGPLLSKVLGVWIVMQMIFLLCQNFVPRAQHDDQ